jgi:anti-anti-sigma factor
MKTTIEQLEGCTLVTLDGELNTAASAEVKNTLTPLIENGSGNIVIECKDLTYIASSGLRILLSILKSVKTNGGKLTLRNVNDNVKKIFSLTGFVKIFDFE